MASELQRLRFESPLPPENLTSVDRRSGWHDMTDCDEAAWVFQFGTVSNNITQIGVLGSDDGGSTFGTISAMGAFGGSLADLPTGTTADNQRAVLFTKGSAAKLQRAIVGAGASNNLVSCLLIKGKLNESPVDATDRGLLAQIITP